MQEEILRLYPEYNKVYGPYVSKQDGRSRVVFRKGIGKKCITSSRLFAKVRLEAHIGRRLIGEETVDHKDQDPTNDEISNLQILSSSENASKNAIHQGNYRKYKPQFCIICGAEFYNSKFRQTCDLAECRSKNRSRIAKEAGCRPPLRRSKPNR